MVYIGLPEQALGGLPRGLGLVMVQINLQKFHACTRMQQLVDSYMYILLLPFISFFLFFRVDLMSILLVIGQES